MDLNPVILAIPLYFTLMAIELVYESISNRKTYRINDAITNISTGVLSQVTGTFIKIFKIGFYTLVYQHFSFFQLESNWTTFWILFILFDLGYYWEHRLAHRVSLFWGGHSVHHQSEDYNLSVALRQSSTAMIWGFPIYLPLALLGFDPIQLVLVNGLNLIYQFWIHTEHINKLPSWFEAIFNTPSHHRVHHGRDPKYIDKNYAGVFIIWDKIFGSFQIEEERPNYGITKPLNSWNPVYANFAHYIDLYEHSKKARSWKDRAKIFFYPPGWLPDYLGGYDAPREVNQHYQKYNQSNTLAINTYILVQFFAALGLNSYYFFSNEDFTDSIKIIYSIWIILTTLMFGFLFEKNNWWLSLLEYTRLAAIPLGAFYFLNTGLIPIQELLWITSLFSLISIIAFFYLKRRCFEGVRE